MTNILVFPCGSEIGVEVYRSLKNEKNIKIYGGSSVEDQGRLIFENYIGDLPFCDNHDFIPFLSEIVKKHKIDYVYPSMDIVLPILKENEEKIGCRIITSPLETTKICLSKKLTYQKLKGHIRVPQLFEKNEIIDFPVFSKPEIGSSSRNVFKINNRDDLNYLMVKYPNNLILEYLPGDEYTVDCFTEKNGDLIFISPRKRCRVLNGISANTKIVNNDNFYKIAQVINKELKFNGSWFFQVKEDSNGELCLMEIACRFGGSSLINRYRNVNLPLLSLYNEMGKNISINENKIDVDLERGISYKIKTKINFENVYVDLDDTLIINNLVNLEVLSFIYDCNNKGKNVVLITKHKHDTHKTLENFKIHKNIFKEIITISETQKKSDYMKMNSIFIDDSFSERNEVNQKLNIPTFSPSSINILFNL